MAKGVFACIDGVSRNVKQIPLCIDGVSRNTKEGWACVDGVSRQFFGGGIEVGQSVFLKLNGFRKEFIIVHKGLPSSAYDASCDGIWIVNKEGYGTQRWDSGGYMSYKNSTIHNFLNNDRFFLLESSVQNIVKQVKIPIASGQLSTKLFLLSYTEVFGNTNSDVNTEGAMLDYFKEVSAPLSGTWWLRTEHSQMNCAWQVDGSGNSNYSVKSNQTSLRFAMILPHDTQFDSNFNIIA